jgi:PKD repeat protein
MIDNVAIFDEELLTFSTKLSQTGDNDIYVVIDPESTIDELETSNNTQFKSIKIVDNDIAAPEFIIHSHTELSGDNDGLIEDDEYIQINWSLSDISGINSTYVIFNGAQVQGMSNANGNYFAIIENQISGEYPYQIHATDNDNTSMSSLINDALIIIQGSPKIISKSPVAGEKAVTLNSKVEAMFDLAINPSTINETNFLVNESASGAILSASSIKYFPELKKVVFEPALLKYETEYKVRIKSGTNGLRDINNNSLESDVIWTFETAKAPLIADFYITNQEISIKKVLYFKDISTGHPVSWYWDFGDGNLSTTQNPEHTYEQSGFYNVRLIVIDADGNSSSKTISINAVVSKVIKYSGDIEFSLNPNPATDVVYLRSSANLNSGLRISILDNSGRILLTKDVKVLSSEEPMEIDISSLKEGIYILKFGNSTTVNITKLVKH